MYKIALLEDSTEILLALRSHFKQSVNIELVFDSDTVERFLKFCGSHTDIDLVLLDINLPFQSGVEAIAPIRKMMPDVEIVMFTIVDDQDKVFQSICAGANGYLLKMLTPEELEKQLLLVLEGSGSVLSPAIARRVLRFFSGLPPAKSTETPSHDLSKTEFQIVKFLSQGLTYEQIGEMLGLTVAGIRYHITNIYKKLNVNSRSQVTRMFFEGRFEF